VYINCHPSGTEGSTLKRATLVQTTVALRKGDQALVFYGPEYKKSAMPEMKAKLVLDLEQT
jgi:hypothetical protein